MAFTAKKYRDLIKRKSFAKKESSISISLSLINNQIGDFESRQEMRNKFSKQFKKKSSVCRVKNRCLMTNRAYSVNRFFRISRLSLRELARNGSLLGLKRASW